MAAHVRAHWPAAVALALGAAFALWRMAGAGWDPAALAQPGTRYASLDPQGSEGYDGQFALYIALDPDPARVAPHLDVPAYRYQRILYPLLAWALAVGQPQVVPWALLAVNLAAHALGTAAVAALLGLRGLPRGYALVFAAWAGLVGGVGLHLNEPLAYALVAGGWLALDRRRPALAGVLLGLALLAKETTVTFWAAAALASLFEPRAGRARLAFGAGGALFAVWQVWLWRQFGAPGLGSGGAMATPFEWIPYMGFLRIAGSSLSAMAVFALLFGPSIVLPSLWGLWAAARRLLGGPADREAWALGLNALAIALLPFSTFREPLALIRFGSGLVLAVLCFASCHGPRRALNYALFWSAFLVMLIPR